MIKTKSKFNHTVRLLTFLLCSALYNISHTANATEPVVTSSPVIAVDEDAPYEYLLTATDSDNDPLTWAVKPDTGLPSWLTLATKIQVTTVAGAGVSGTTDHENPLSASFDMLWGFAVDGNDNIFIAEFDSHKIRKIDALSGAVTTIAGSGETGAADNVDGLLASFGSIRHIAVDAVGNIYVIDTSNNKVRRVDGSSGAVSTLAGSGLPGSQDNSNPLLAQFNNPYGIAVDADGHVYVSAANKIRKIDAVTGAVTTVAGSGEVGEADHENPLDATFIDPRGLDIDRAGNLLIVDGNTIRKVARMLNGLTGPVTTLAGSGTSGSDDHENPLLATFNGPLSIVVDMTGNIFVADHLNHKIRKIQSSGRVSPVAGSGATGGRDNDDGQLATFNFPTAIAVDGKDSLYVADWLNYTIRKVTPFTRLSGSPLNDHVGEHPVFLQLDDGTTPVDHDFVVTVNNTNDNPQISGQPLASVFQDIPYVFDADGTDVDVGDSLTYSIINRPGWAVLDEVDGILWGTPRRDDVGITSQIVISVTDNEGASADLPAFDLTVVLVNDPPVVTEQDIELDEDTVEQGTFIAVDPQIHDELTFSFVTNAEHGAASIDGDGWTYVPDANYYGSDSFSVVANDGIENSAVALFNITVQPVDDAEIALNDIIVLQVGTQGSNRYELDVLVNDNTSENAADALILVGAFSPVGDVWIEQGKLWLQIEANETTLVSGDYVVQTGSGQYVHAQADVIFQ